MRPDALVQKKILAVMISQEKSWDLWLSEAEVRSGLLHHFKLKLIESRVRAVLERLCRQGIVGKKAVGDRVLYQTRRSHLSDALVGELESLCQ